MFEKVSSRAPQTRQLSGKTRLRSAAGSFRATVVSTVGETGVSHRLLKIHLQRNNILLQDWFGKVQVRLWVLDFSDDSFRFVASHLWGDGSSTYALNAPCTNAL